MLASLRALTAAYAPTAISLFTILVIGLLVSLIGKRLVRSVVARSGLEAAAEKGGVAPVLYALGARSGLAAFLGGVTFWAGLLGTIAVLSDRLGLGLVRQVIAGVLAYAPRVVVALAIAFGAIFLGGVVQRAIERLASTRSEVRKPGPIAAAARGLVVMVGITLAAEQAGLEVRFLTTIFEVVVGVTCLAIGLAFALGFHGVVRGMAARHYYKPLVRPGDHVRVGEDEGTVVKFGSTAVVLRDAGQERIIPCDRFLSGTVIVTKERSREGG